MPECPGSEDADQQLSPLTCVCAPGLPQSPPLPAACTWPTSLTLTCLPGPWKHLRLWIDQHIQVSHQKLRDVLYHPQFTHAETRPRKQRLAPGDRLSKCQNWDLNTSPPTPRATFSVLCEVPSQACGLNESPRAETGRNIHVSLCLGEGM